MSSSTYVTTAKQSRRGELYLWGLVMSKEAYSYVLEGWTDMSILASRGARD